MDKEKNWRGRKIKEVTQINKVVPTNTVDKGYLMNLEKDYDLDAIWSEFNPDIRDHITVSYTRF